MAAANGFWWLMGFFFPERTSGRWWTAFAVGFNVLGLVLWGLYAYLEKIEREHPWVLDDPRIREWGETE